MHLKSLSMRGFKSFADRINLRFEPGITVIVGPNGSGKSNITDGALWALGEQKPTSLRGSTMEDVIFAGSATRPALGVAEVTVCLDNSDDYLPIEFSDVTITRRVFRSGESEYFINKAACRLIDVQELLSDTSLGKEMYTIIGQGQLDEILSGKPEDRRLLIEEVAQVLKHKRRREKASNKMALMEQNLFRAKDVISEVSRQLQPLKEQALRAQNHQNMAKELKELQTDLAVRDLKQQQEEWNDLLKIEGSTTDDLNSAKEKISFQEERIQQLQIELEEKGLYAGDLEEQMQRLRTIYEKLNTGLLLLEEKGKNLINRLSEVRQTVYQTEKRKKQKQLEIGLINDKRTSLDSRLSVLLKKLADLRKKAEGVKKTWLHSEQAFSDLEEEILTMRAVLMKKEDERSHQNLEITEIEGRASFLKKRRIEVKKEKLTADKRSKQLVVEMGEGEKKKSLIEHKIITVQKKMAEISSQIELRQDEVNTLRQEIMVAESSLDVLANKASYYPSYPHFISSARFQKEFKTVGVLSDLIEVDHGYEKAIERVLGDYLFALIVEKSTAVSPLLALAQKEEAGFVAVLNVHDLQPRPDPGKRPDSGISALEVTSITSGYLPLLQSLLSRVWITDDLQTAIRCRKKHPDHIFITAKGEMIDEQGLITASYGTSQEGNVLACQREIEQNRILRSDLDEALKKKLSELEKAHLKVKDMTAQLNSSRDELTGKEHHLNQLSLERDSIEGLKEKLSVEEKGLDEEIIKLTESLTQNEEMSVVLRQEIKELYEKIEVFQVDLNVLRKDKTVWSKKENEVTKELNGCQLEINSINEKQKDLKQQLAIVEEEIEEQDGLLGYEEKVVNALELLRSRIHPVHEQYTHLLHFVVQKIELINTLTADEKNISISIKEVLKESQEEIRRLNRDQEGRTKKLSEIQLTKGQLEVKVTAAVQKIVDEYDLPLEKALEIYPKDLPRTDCEGRIKKLRTKIAALGAVNPVAVEQFNEVEKRHDYLQSQLSDLVESKKVLNRVIAAIDKKIKEKFMETFEEVNINFQNVFNFLFPGGRAELILLDPEDPLGSGIEIEAQPSGKKLKKLSLLSGGERALVALALLFAVHETRPSPFYILDEVEPALDDINLQRFIALLKKMKHQTQFLIISHQRRTMEIADSLYGVSMQADGVSKAFSQKLKPVSQEAG